ncbi:hypothetical protein DUY81_01850 [Acidipropionibacterium acidipropionici]|uniref:hypothetical protein n=1 Tax=Acidipropionibacterium acidipropionici TaxID=1748 RepID=UPI000F7BC62D|nr:hypothetical protein [Acidipropionibacterium acidipropionici]AZP36717.1 hypothetical protein DUY81_01850 [Acidipropionibacterium acidipropionici]
MASMKALGGDPGGGVVQRIVEDGLAQMESALADEGSGLTGVADQEQHLHHEQDHAGDADPP